MDGTLKKRRNAGLRLLMATFMLTDVNRFYVDAQAAFRKRRDTYIQSLEGAGTYREF
jgi:hypothetical protein